jgi:hypothetical protein
MLTKTPADNTGFASGGLTGKLGSFCFYSSSVFSLSNNKKAPHHGEAFLFFRF